MKKQLIASISGILVASIMGFIILTLQGYNAIASFTSLFDYSLFSVSSFNNTLVRTAPLLLTGLSAAIAFGSNAVNLGQPGQFLMGAMAATYVGMTVDLPPVLMVPLLLVSAMTAGMLWSGIAALFKIYFRMNEFITTLMLNFIAEYTTMYLISGPLLDPKLYSPMTEPINSGGILPYINGFPTTFAIATAAIILVYIFWQKTKLGYELRIMGKNSSFSFTGGCNNRKNFLIIMLISGALAGLAGSMIVQGGLQHRFLKGMGADYAWDGVMIAIVANNGILGTGFYALFFGMLQTGALGMELETSVPSEFVLVFQAITVLFVVASRGSAHLILDKFSVLSRIRSRSQLVSPDSSEAPQ